jgi:hypothetical protein
MHIQRESMEAIIGRCSARDLRFVVDSLIATHPPPRAELGTRAYEA